jgi:hypothetical protein
VLELIITVARCSLSEYLIENKVLDTLLNLANQCHHPRVIAKAIRRILGNLEDLQQLPRFYSQVENSQIYAKLDAIPEDYYTKNGVYIEISKFNAEDYEDMDDPS